MKYLILLITILATNLVNAQVVIQNEQGEIKSNLDLFEENKFVEKQVANLTIIEGNSNIVNFRQIGVNEVNAYVKGDYNQLFITQGGIENNMEIIQEGDGNYLNSNNFSSSTKIANIQIGNNNYIDQNLINADDSKFIIVQNGSNLRLNHTVQGVTDTGLEVKMYGKGMEITIETNQ